jgi:hypothetical protein
MRSISAGSRRHVIIVWCCKGQGRRPRAAGLTRVHGRRRPSSKPMAVRQIGSKCHHTGPHAHATDAFGTPLEFCASMPEMPRMITRFTHATPTALALRHPRSARLRLLRGGGLPPERIHCPKGGPLPRAACPCSARAIRMISITPRCLVTGRTADRTPSGNTDRLQLAEAAFSSVMFRRPPG